MAADLLDTHLLEAIEDPDIAATTMGCEGVHVAANQPYPRRAPAGPSDTSGEGDCKGTHAEVCFAADVDALVKDPLGGRSCHSDPDAVAFLIVR